MVIDYYEDLTGTGSTCPPNDVFYGDGKKEYYRIVKADPPTPVCFYSHRKKYPDKQFSDECEARSLSISDSIPHLMNSFYRTPAGKKKARLVAVLKLKRADGCLKQAGAFYHHSWWRSTTFDLSSVKIQTV